MTMTTRDITITWRDPLTDEEGAFSTRINGTMDEVKAYYHPEGWRWHLNIGDGAGGDREVIVINIEEIPSCD